MPAAHETTGPDTAFDTEIFPVPRTDTFIRVRSAGGEVVGEVSVLAISDDIMTVGGTTVLRSSTTQDWAVHRRRVAEHLLIQAAQVADGRQAMLMVVRPSMDMMVDFLHEQGFNPAGVVWRREGPAS